jgi:hypothetical protein
VRKDSVQIDSQKPDLFFRVTYAFFSLIDSLSTAEIGMAEMQAIYEKVM